MHALTFALPGLHWPHCGIPLPELATPALNTLLHWGRAHVYPTRRRSDVFGRYLWRGSLLQHARQTLGLPESQPTFWCSPLHQHLGMHSVQIAHSTELAWRDGEAAAWCARLNRFFADDGWRFWPYRADLWLVGCPETPQWQATNILDLDTHIGADSKPHGVGSAALLQAQTEIQMLLHQHPLNQERQQHGQLPLNGMWFWRDLCGHADPQTLLLSHSPWAAPDTGSYTPHRADNWATLQQQSARHADKAALVVFADEAFAPAAHHGDAHGYAAQLHHWDRHWFRPALDALSTGCLKRLDIVCEQHSLSIHKPVIRPFWRRTPPFRGQCS